MLNEAQFLPYLACFLDSPSTMADMSINRVGRVVCVLPRVVRPRPLTLLHIEIGGRGKTVQVHKVPLLHYTRTGQWEEGASCPGGRREIRPGNTCLVH